MSQANDVIPVADEVQGRFERECVMGDHVLMRGHVLVECFGPDGELKESREVDNLITTVGRAQIVEQLLAAPAAGTKVTHMGVGTGTVAPAVGDTALTADVRVALTSKTRATNVLTLVGDWAAGVATQTNSEAGCWDAATAGTLHARATFTGIAKGASDTLKVTWTWTIG